MKQALLEVVRSIPESMHAYADRTREGTDEDLLNAWADLVDALANTLADHWRQLLVVYAVVVITAAIVQVAL